MSTNVKRFFVSNAHSEAITLSVQRVVDGFYLQSSDGTFGASSSMLDMTESMDGGYSLNESRTIWNDGLYDVVFYLSTAPIAGSGFEFQIVSDNIMNLVALVAIAARNAIQGIVPPLTIIQNAIESLATKTSVLQGQVNDISYQSRQANGST